MARTIANFTTTIDGKDVVIKHTVGAYENIWVTVDGIRLDDQDSDISIGMYTELTPETIHTIATQYPIHVKAYTRYMHNELNDESCAGGIGGAVGIRQNNYYCPVVSDRDGKCGTCVGLDCDTCTQNR